MKCFKGHRKIVVFTFSAGWKLGSRSWDDAPSSRSVKSLVSCWPNRISGFCRAHSASVNSLKFIDEKNYFENLTGCVPPDSRVLRDGKSLLLEFMRIRLSNFVASNKTNEIK